MLCGMFFLYIFHMWNLSWSFFGLQKRLLKTFFTLQHVVNFVVSWLTLRCLPQECYVHNLLRVTVYIPSIRRDVLGLIIGKMLQLDVSNSKSGTMEMTSTAEWKKIVTTNLCVWCISGKCFSDRHWGRRVHSYGEPAGPAPERGGTVWHGINIKHFLIQ